MDTLQFQKNPETAAKMSAYIKHQFVFAGTPAPERQALSKQLLKESHTWPKEKLCQEIEAYYQKTEREYQYVAIDLALQNVRRFSLEEVVAFKAYVPQKAWWDSVDAWRKFFGSWVALHLTELPTIFALFYGAENFWNRRVALNLQLMLKEKTNQDLLKKAIIYDRTTEEFFIQKAIGW